MRKEGWRLIKRCLYEEMESDRETWGMKGGKYRGSKEVEERRKESRKGEERKESKREGQNNGR